MVTANIYPISHFTQYDSAYCGESTKLWNDKMFFGLCSHEPNCSAGFFSFDVNSKRINHLFSIDEVIRTKAGYLPQGKIHTKIFRGIDDKFYFGTHFAYPNCIPQCVKYEGGYLLSYDPATEIVENHGILIDGEGIVTLILDRLRMHCYALTAPSFYFVDYDILNRKIVFSNRVTEDGSVCRSLGLDGSGDVYGSCEHFRVFRYKSTNRDFEFLRTNFESVSDNTNEWESPKKQGANRVGRALWRCIEYNDETNRFYGVNSSNSKLFEFDIKICSFRNIGKTTSSPYDNIYPTLTLSRFGNTYYYAPANGKFDYQLSEGIESTCSLIGFNSKSGKLSNYGPVIGFNRERIYGAASAMCSEDGKLYLLGAVSPKDGDEKSRLLQVDNIYYSLALIEIDLFTLE